MQRLLTYSHHVIKTTIMRKELLILPALVLLVFISCEEHKELQPVKLKVDGNYSFQGVIKTDNSDSIRGTVSLDIFNKHYVCSTHVPYGDGAGKLELNDTTINFVDTVFINTQTLYVHSYVLSGKYRFEFDGDILKMRKYPKADSLQYYLRLNRAIL